MFSTEKKFTWWILNNSWVSILLDKVGMVFIPIEWLSWMEGWRHRHIWSYTGLSGTLALLLSDRQSNFHCSLNGILTQLSPSQVPEQILEQGSDKMRWGLFDLGEQQNNLLDCNSSDIDFSVPNSGEESTEPDFPQLHKRKSLGRMT